MTGRRPAEADEGIDYFFVDQHGVANADPRPVYGIYAPIRLPGGCHALARDGDASRQVWSAREGYPGDPAYREFSSRPGIRRRVLLHPPVPALRRRATRRRALK